MIFTYAYLDLPKLPDSIITAARQAIDMHKDNHDIKVNNWLDRPGYAEYEYRNFTVADGTPVKTIKSHRYAISEEFNQWVIKYFNQDPSTCGVAYYDDHSSLFAPHVDISRDYTIMYLLELGGTNVETLWYQQQGHSILRPDLKSVFDPDKIVTNYDDLIEIDRVCLPLERWVCINSAILHEVQNIQSSRLAIQISRNSLPENIKFDLISYPKLDKELAQYR